MRRLTKASPPDVLAENAAAWTEEYLDARAAGERLPSRWRHRSIVNELAAETRQKCAYCEALVRHVAYPHVEHIRPKSVRPELALEWSNLTLGCQICNTAKGTYYDETAPLVHPYEDLVSDHIAFRGPMILARPGSDIGERTITRLDLRRGALFIERMKRLEALHSLIERWVRAQDADRPVFEKLLQDAMGEEQEFVACLREYAASLNVPIADDVA